jgi:hypothetical protein
MVTTTVVSEVKITVNSELLKSIQGLHLIGHIVFSSSLSTNQFHRHSKHLWMCTSELQIWPTVSPGFAYKTIPVNSRITNGLTPNLQDWTYNIENSLIPRFRAFWILINVSRVQILQILQAFCHFSGFPYWEKKKFPVAKVASCNTSLVFFLIIHSWWNGIPEHSWHGKDWKDTDEVIVQNLRNGMILVEPRKKYE